LNPDDSVTLIIAASADGYAEATPAALAAEPAMVLQPWGRLEGTLLVQGRPGTNCTLAFALGVDRRTGTSADFTAYQAKTDDTGHFAFAQVPPGSQRLLQLIEMPGTPSQKGLVRLNQPLTSVDIRPGETTTVTVTAALPYPPASANP
jgi:hypothetical protein